MNYEITKVKRDYNQVSIFLKFCGKTYHLRTLESEEKASNWLNSSYAKGVIEQTIKY